MASSGRAIVLGALLAGLAVGFRTQTFWITVPLLLARARRSRRSRSGRRDARFGHRLRRRRRWPGRVPLRRRQRRAAGLPGGARQPGRRGLRRRRDAVPESDAAAGRVRAAAHLRVAVGQRAAGRRRAGAGDARRPAPAAGFGERRTLAAVAAISAPYLVFHLAFQDTTFARYALPVVLAGGLPGRRRPRRGRARRGPRRRRPGRVEPQHRRAAAVGLRRARQPDRAALRPGDRGGGRGVAGRRSWRCTRRCSVRSRPSRGRSGERLPSPPRREWLELARHWQSGGGRSGVVPGRCAADRSGAGRSSGAAPGRALRVGTLEHVDAGRHASRRRARGTASASPAGSPPRAGASRPKPRAWPASWGRGRTWPRSTPTCAGGRRPAACWSAVAISAPTGSPRPPSPSPSTGKLLDSWPQPPGFFVAPVTRAGRRPRRRRHASPTSRWPRRRRPMPRPVPTAIEQFDLQSPGITMWAFGRGFHEPELDNQRGRAWRWMSDEARLEIPQTAGDVTLVLEGESPLTYFDVAVHAGGVERRGASSGTVPLVGRLRRPARASAPRASRPARARCASPPRRPSRRPSAARSADRRRLGLRLFTVASSPACRPAETAQIHA